MNPTTGIHQVILSFAMLTPTYRTTNRFLPLDAEKPGFLAIEKIDEYTVYTIIPTRSYHRASDRAKTLWRYSTPAAGTPSIQRSPPIHSLRTR